jgi:hypothetical protein
MVDEFVYHSGLDFAIKQQDKTKGGRLNQPNLLVTGSEIGELLLKQHEKTAISGEVVEDEILFLHRRSSGNLSSEVIGDLLFVIDN